MTASAGPALKRLHSRFGDRVRFVTLYVREAHPGERYLQPDTEERKMEHARRYRSRDAIPWTVMVDDVSGTLHRRLDGKPNSAYLLDGSGEVLFRSLWSNDEPALRESLEAVTEGRRPDPAERETHVRPLLGGMGEMYGILTAAGEEAREDVRREIPPVYGLARLAHAFRPMPSHRRGAAATSVVVAGGLVGLGALTWMLVRRL